MKVTDLKFFLVHPSTKGKLSVSKNWLLVKINTDEGIEGWGEAFTMIDRERSIAQNITDLGRYLLGRNPFLGA